MLKSRSIKFAVIGALALFSASLGSLMAAGPIDHITILGLDTNPQFTAGVTTNTPTTTIFINTFAAGNAAPDAGEVVTLQLLNDGVVVPNGMKPTSFTTQGGSALNGGNGSLPITFFSSGTSISLRAICAADTETTPTFTVNVASATKLLVLGPGMTHVPGTNPSLTTGFSGSFTPQEPEQPFTVRVFLTDAQYNLVAGTDTVSFPDVDMVTEPAPTAMTAGLAQVLITMSGARTDRVLIVQDDTDVPDGTVADGALSMTTAGPPAKEVFPFPSPFNPHLSNITFRYRLSEPQNAKLTVTDIFGQKIWEQTTSGNIGFNDVAWNGRNDNGTIVASGVYYVLLEVNGSLESKKRFGVTK